MRTENPYESVMDWIRKNQGNVAAIGLAKLILSLWSDDAAYSVRECMRLLNDVQTEWAWKMITHCLRQGDDNYLNVIGPEVCRLYPSLSKMGIAGSAAKREFERKHVKEICSPTTAIRHCIICESVVQPHGTGYSCSKCNVLLMGNAVEVRY